MHEAALRVVSRDDGQHEVRTAGGDLLAVCATNAEAWAWIDRHSAEGQADTDRHRRVQRSEPFT